MDRGPLIMEPILVPKPWGGRRLAALGKTLPADGSFGESWEIADLPAEDVTSSALTRTVVARGPFQGMSLRSLIADHGRRLLGSATATANGDFPLLVKYLDAAEHLSVQVHPDEEHVGSHGTGHVKTESWYVVDAEPDARLYIGFRDGVELDDVADRLGTPGLVDLLQPIPAFIGEFHHLPAGIVHALGAGVVVAEPQTPSDTTYRLYDWTEEYGRPARELHLEQGLQALHIGARPVSLPAMDADGHRVLIETSAYRATEHRSSIGTIEIEDGHELRVLMITRGQVIISIGGRKPRRVETGGTVIVPAASAAALDVDVGAPATVLEIALV
jgi:mannose-6-phosphate isomerase